MTTRATRVTIVPEGRPTYDELATTVEIQDEGAGEFIEVRQPGRIQNVSDCALAIDPEEWPHIRAVIDDMVASINKVV